MRAMIRKNAGLLVAGLATFVLMGAVQALFGPALPVFARDFALQGAGASVVVSSFWVGCSLGVLGMYLRGQGVTPRHTLALMVAGAGLISAAPLWGAVLAGAAVFGAGYGAATVVFNPRVLRAFGARGPAMVSVMNAAFGVGAILSPLAFVAVGQAPAIAFGACAVIAAGLWLIAGPASRGEGAPPAAPPGRFRPRLGLLLFAVAAIGMEAGLGGLGPTALIAAGLTEVQAAQLLSAFFVAFLAARVGLALIAHLVPPFRIFTAAMALATGFALVASELSAAAGFVGLGMCVALFFPSFYVAGCRALGDDPRVTSLIIGAGLLGGIFGPVILGQFMGRLGADGFFRVIAALAFATTLAALIAGPRLRAQPNSGTRPAPVR